MARATGTVVISFGMMNVGVKMYLSASSEQVGFNMINPKTGNRISQKLVDSVTKEDVERGDTVKGYEYTKDKYVTFTDEEVSNMQAERRDTLDIKEFIPVSDVDPLHVEKTHYTAPDKGFDKAYTLLYTTLNETNRAAVGTLVSRGKEHLVVIRAYQHGLIMHQMFYDTEVRSFENKCAKIAISPVELAMGKMMVEQFAVDKFDKSKYSDKFIDKLNAAVEMKLKGGAITEVEQKINTSNMVDSMRQSLLSMGVPEAKIAEMMAKAMAETAATKAQPEPISQPVVEAPVKATRSRKKTAANG